MQRYLLLGTAGHVDHGKTSLIQALTGVDTDRLPEEKRRGITVDLGFAALELEGLLLGIVDVPGHERFIKNMLAGATGVDMALLVVAADEAVMPQTREHFEALSFLGLSAGVIAITKCDLVDDEMLALVTEEVADLVAGSFLQDSAIVPVSANTGQGLGELRSGLAAAAKRIPARNEQRPFRMSVDRSFSAAGHGTIVTGSVASGRVSCGDQLQLLPQETLVNVRGIESHGRQLTSVGQGQRAALNLTGVHYSAIERGNTLATASSLAPSRLLSVNIQASRFREKPLKSRAGVRFYHGATETVGRLRLLESNVLSAGQSQIGQIELRQPVCTTWGEPFVVRGLTSNELLGGGQVIDSRAYRVATKDRWRIERIRDLAASDEPTRVAALVALAGIRSWTFEEFSQRAGTTNLAAVTDRLAEAGTLIRFDLKGTPRWLHHQVAERLETRFRATLEQEHQQNRLRAQIPLGRLQPHFVTLEPPELLTAVAIRLSEAGQVRFHEGNVALADWQPELSMKQVKLLEAIVASCAQAGLKPPSLAELAAQLDKSLDEIATLVEVAVSRDDLIPLPDKDSRDPKLAQRARLYLHQDARSLLLDRLTTLLVNYPEWTVSQFGEQLGLSRKYAIPLCKYLDQIGVTLRQGDLRQFNNTNSITT